MSPNIIQIIVDDMGYGDFGCFNFGASQTPVLDQLISDGVCLTQHYSASPVCAPARAALLTGRYPHRTGAIDTLEGRGLDRLALDEITVADELQAAGYSTGLVGKWHNGALDERYHPNNRGFGEFIGFRGGWQDYWDWHIERNGMPLAADGRYLTDVFTDEAVAFINRHRREPFYLHLAYNAPHFPLQAPPADVEPFMSAGAFTQEVATLYGMIRVMDRGVGRVLETLDQLELAENTIVTFSSDNGPQLSGRGTSNSLDRYNCGFNGQKTLVYEGGIRVPMVVRWPNGLKGRRQVHDIAHFTDWRPTLLAMTGVTPSPNALPVDGRNILPMLSGEGDGASAARFWQWNRYEPVARCNAAMRAGDWKLVYPVIPSAFTVTKTDQVVDQELKYHPGRHTSIIADPLPAREIPKTPPAPQLFNIAADPLERNDLAELEPERVLSMAAELDRWFESVESERTARRDTQERRGESV